MPRAKSSKRVKLPEPVVITDPVEAAKAAELRYVSDDGPCIRRKRAGKGFSYISPDNKPIHDPAEVKRINALRIPPAWTDVWICPKPNGHIQATGRDAKGRKQYRYHARWRDIRNETKFNRMIAFGELLPQIRERISHDLDLPGLPREKVLALAVRLLEATHIRIGNEEYTRMNHSFGLTTLRDKHVEVTGGKVTFEFRGKSGKDHSISLKDRRLARLIQRCKDIPGQDLFQYIDEQGQRHTISSTDVNAYLHDVSGQDFTAKDFRTWGGTVLAVQAFQEIGTCEAETALKKNIAQAVRVVAGQLRNTPAVCSKYYLHPAMIEAYRDGSLLAALDKLPEDQSAKASASGLSRDERIVMEILQKGPK